MALPKRTEWSITGPYRDENGDVQIGVVMSGAVTGDLRDKVSLHMPDLKALAGEFRPNEYTVTLNVVDDPTEYFRRVED